MAAGLAKFKRFAVNVWEVDPTGKTDVDTAAEGLKAMETWMKGIGLVLSLKELGVTEEMFEGIADGTFILTGGYQTLTRKDVIDILKKSM